MTITDAPPPVTDVSGYLRAVRRSWWLVLACAVLCAAVAGTFARGRPSEYTAYSTVLVNPLGFEPTRGLAAQSVEIEVETELASSYVVAERAVTLLGPDSTRIVGADPARELRRSIGVSGRGDRIVELSYTSPDPSLARAVTAAYTDAYLEIRLELLSASRTEALANIEDRRSELRERLGNVTAELTRLAGEGTLGNTVQARETALQIEQTQLVSRLADLDQEEADIESLSTRSGEVIGPAQLPDSPTSPGDLQMAIAGGALGLLLGLAIVWFLDRHRSRIRSIDELLERARIPAIGTVEPPATIRASATSDAAPDYAMLATTAMAQVQALGQQGSTVIAVASIGDNTSAATTALGMAKALAASERVIVVSADLADDQLGLALGLQSTPGVTAYLEGTPTAPRQLAPNIDVLPAGRTTNASELVRSILLSKMIVQLQHHYDVILLATPGLGSRPEAAAIAWAAGSVLLCIDPERDSRNGFATATVLLDGLSTPVIGAATVEGGSRKRALQLMGSMASSSLEDEREGADLPGRPAATPPGKDAPGAVATDDL